MTSALVRHSSKGMPRSAGDDRLLSPILAVLFCVFTTGIPCRADPLASATVSVVAPASGSVAFASVVPESAAPVSGSLTVGLADCLIAALSTNPGILSAGEEVRASREREKRAAGARLPRLKAQETFTRLRHAPEISLPGAGSMPLGKDQIQLKGLNFTQPLYTGGAIENGRRAARAEVKMQGSLERRKREEIAQSVAEAWFGLLSARAMEEVASQALFDTLGHERHVQNMFDAGVAVRDDLLKVQVSVLERRENVVRARNGIDLALARLAMLTGLPLDLAMIDTPSDDGDRQTVPGVGEGEALALASHSHPLLESAQEVVRMQHFAARAARGALLPNVALQWNWSSGNQFNASQDNWDATVYVGLALFDGQEARTKIREARAGKNKAAHDLDDLRRNITLAIHQAALRIEEAGARFALSGQAELQAVEALRLTEERYKAGAATSQSLLDAESALVSARQRRVTAGFDRETARVALWHAAGALERALLPDR